MRYVTEGPGIPPGRAPYSAAAIAGEYAFLSGQGPFTTDDVLVTGDFEAQARQTFDNVLAVVAALGASPREVARVGVYLRDMPKDFPAMNALFQEYFPEPFPARTTVPTPGLRFDIEVDAIVWLGGRPS